MADATEGSTVSPTDSNMDTTPTTNTTNATEHQAQPVLLSGPMSPWFKARWRLEIRLANDTNHAFDARTAYGNFVATALQAFPDMICFGDNTGCEYFRDMVGMPAASDFHLYFQGAKSHRPEHGAYRYYMVVEVQTRYLAIQDVKRNKQFLQFLHSTDTWLTYHYLDSLDIQAAGFFTLRHPHWTHQDSFHYRTRLALTAYLQDLDVGTLAPDQAAAVIPYKTGGHELPRFDLCIQNIRAYYARSKATKSEKANKPQAKFIAAEALEFRCSRVHTDLFVCLLEGITQRDHWSLGRFAPYQLCQDSPDHFRACVAEQHKFINSTSFLAIHNADSSIFDGLLPIDTMNNHPGFIDATAPMSLRSFLLNIPGPDDDDPKNTPQFLALECDSQSGVWKLLCPSEHIQDCGAWYDDNFLALYQATDRFSRLPTQSVARHPFRRTIRSDRKARAALMEESGLSMELPKGRSAPQVRKTVKVMIDEQSFPELVNPWQPVTNPTAAPPSHKNLRRSGKVKKQVSYADAVTVSSSQSTALTSAPTTTSQALEHRVNQLASQLQDQTRHSTSLREELSTLQATVNAQADQITTVRQTQAGMATTQATIQNQVEAIQTAQVTQAANQQQVSQALERLFQRLDANDASTHQQFDYLANLIRQQQPAIPAPTPSPPQLAAPHPGSNNESDPSLPAPSSVPATSATPSRPNTSRPRDPNSNQDPDTSSPPHKRTCPPALSPDTQYALENSSPIHVPDETPPATSDQGNPTSETQTAQHPATLFPSVTAPVAALPPAVPAPSTNAPSPVLPSAPPRIMATRDDVAAASQPQPRPTNGIINPYATSRRNSGPPTGNNTTAPSGTTDRSSDPVATTGNTTTTTNNGSRPPAAPDPNNTNQA